MSKKKSENTELPKRGAGRPKAEIDFEVVKKLSAMFAKDYEIAGFFGLSLGCISNMRKNNPEFKAAFDAGRAQGRLNLRRKQLERANEGSDTMLIWLGKNELGQGDKNISDDEYEEGQTHGVLAVAAALPDMATWQNEFCELAKGNLGRASGD